MPVEIDYTTYNIRPAKEQVSLQKIWRKISADNKEIMFLCSFCTMKNYTFSIVEKKYGKLVHAHYEKNPMTNNIELRHMYQDNHL